MVELPSKDPDVKNEAETYINASYISVRKYGHFIPAHSCTDKSQRGY